MIAISGSEARFCFSATLWNVKHPPPALSRLMAPGAQAEGAHNAQERIRDLESQFAAFADQQVSL